MKRALFVALGLALAVVPTTANAQIFNGTPMPLEYLKFIGGPDQPRSYGVQVGPCRSRV